MGKELYSDLASTNSLEILTFNLQPSSSPSSIINMPHLHVELSKTGFQGRPHDDHEHVSIHKFNENFSTDESHHFWAAVAEIHAGEPVPVHYHGPAAGYVIEGELHINDESTPDKVTKLVAGDVIHIDQESRLTLSSPNKGKLFGASYSPSHLHVEDYILKK